MNSTPSALAGGREPGKLGVTPRCHSPRVIKKAKSGAQAPRLLIWCNPTRGDAHKEDIVLVLTPWPLSRATTRKKCAALGKVTAPMNHLE